LDDLQSRLRTVEDRIAAACERVRRDPAGVRLVVVTKTVDAGVIRELAALGVQDIGENRVQDAAPKIDSLRDIPGLRFHMIGHLQRNKARQAVRLFHVIHSIDSLQLAQAVDRAVGEETAAPRPVPVLLEVNVSGEESKFGMDASAALETAAVVAALPNLCLDGLMTMAPLGAGEQQLRGVFRGLRELAERIRGEQGIAMPHLSMGMSQDYEIAVEEGATLVRVGTAIVG